MLMTLLQAGQDTSAHFEAGRLIGIVIVVALLLLLVLVIARIVSKRADKARAAETASDKQVWQQVADRAQTAPHSPQSSSPSPRQRQNPAAAPKTEPISEDTPVIARCPACMGRWKTTKAEADALDACPKCGASPPDLRLQRAG